MSWWINCYYKLLNLPISLLVKNESIPTDPIKELGLDPKRPILYVLPYNSKADLLTMRRVCLQFNLTDPLQELEIGDKKLPRYVFIDKGPRVFNYYSPKEKNVKIFLEYLDLHKQYPELDVQLVPVSVMFGRAPERENNKILKLQLLNGFEKFIAVIRSGRNCFTRFSNSISLRYIVDELGSDQVIAHKLARVARIHFYRQRLAAVGPKLPDRKELFKKLLASKAIERAIEEEAKSKKISQKKARQNAIEMMDEIAADFRYGALRITDKVLTWAWNRMYQGLNINNAEQVRKLAQDGHEIVYAPCHRSHMDYLLLSYVLYRQGLVPPHIAAGVNLNFWPAGPIFRRLGAFFMRRTFIGSKLYATVFREYLGQLFSRGYSVEYFVEGGRSRTGRLLDPRTGTLSMTIQAMLRGDTRPITIVPVHIGYEHVMEVGTYARELRGAAKKKENLWQVMCALRKLRNLGFGYVNFGEPIPLTSYLNRHAPDWRESIDPIETPRPGWLPPVVASLANQLMIEINKAAAVNAMNLCCTALLSSRQRALTREMLVGQINCYLQLLHNVPYARKITIPQQTVEQMIEHVINMDKVRVDHDSAGEIISLPREQAVLMTYYRNNIQHLFALPSLLASIIMYYVTVTRDEVIKQTKVLYPLLQQELFIRYKMDELEQQVNAFINELIRQNLVLEKNGLLSVKNGNIITLQLLANGVRETIQRYAISIFLLKDNPDFSRSTLEKESRVVAERLSILHGINAPEFFDKGVFAILVNTLRQEGYLDDAGDPLQEKLIVIYNIINNLLTPDVKQTIKSASKRFSDLEE